MAEKLGYFAGMLKAAATNPFGALLREWRLARRLTQENLAERAEVSTRHLSCLENGRAQASRDMVLAIGTALELPLRERNALLVAGGYASVYRESSLDDASMHHVRRAFDQMLAQQEPFPGLVIDRAWNIRRVNAGGARFFARVFGSRVLPPEVTGNLAHAVFHPDGLRHVIVDWPALAASMAARLHRDAAAEPNHAALRDLRDTVLAYPGVPKSLQLPTIASSPPIAVAVHVRLPDGAEARLFAMLASLGTPLDITAEELSVELYFPMDDASEKFLRAC